MNTNHDALREALELLRIFKNNLGPNRAALTAEDAILWDRVEALSQLMPEETEEESQQSWAAVDAPITTAAPEGAKPEQCQECAIQPCATCPDVAAQPPNPQPQAQGEPEVVDLDDAAGFCRVAFGKEAGAFNNGVDDLLAELKRRGPLITLQSHREAFNAVRLANVEAKQMWDMLYADYKTQKEALAQHRAALEECVGALKRHLCPKCERSNACCQPLTSAAITNANQVLEGGGV